MLVLTAPAYLLLLLPLALATAALALVIARRPPPRYRPEMILRFAALAVLVLAIAQPKLRHSAARHDLVVVLDTSASISPADRAVEADWLRRALSTASADAPVAVVGFAGTSVATTLYNPPSARTLVALMRPVGGGTQTDIARALRLAAGIAAPGARLVLLSDGVPTLGDAAGVVAELAERGIAVDVVPLAGRQSDVALTRLSLPPAVPAGADLSLQLTLSSTRAMTGTLTVTVDGQRLGTESVALRAGDAPYVVDVPGQATGWHSVRVSIAAPDDAIPENDVLSAATDVAPVPRVLLVAAHAGTTAAATFAGGVATIVPLTPTRMPATSEALDGYAGIVLDDLPASALTGAQISALDSAVRQRGVGLLVLGGPHSLTQGGYNQSALERLLPVLSDTPASLQDGNVALQLVLDRSGSMDDLAGDVPKIVMSRAAAHLAADFAIAHTDDLGILDFDQASHVLVPIGKVTTGDASRIARAIDGMVSDGGTNIYQGLQDGIQQVSRSAAPYHHIILMTDGRSDPADYRPLLRQAQQRKITISTVGLGPDADVQLLQSIATAGKGRFYYTTNARDLPRIFAEETRLAAGSASVTGTIGVRIPAGSATTRSLGTGPLLPLGGYTATVLKSDATDDLQTSVRGRKPDPLLARWYYGLGRVLVWTPGLENAWSASWRRAEPAFWADTLRWTLRGTSPDPFAPSLAAGPSPDALQIDTLRNGGGAVELRRLAVEIRAPAGLVSRLVATQTGAGLYVAPYPFDAPGVYDATVTGGGAPPRALLAVPYSREYLPTPPDTMLLAAIAAGTGGKVLRDPSEVLPPHPAAGTSLALWWALALASLTLFVAAVAWGRLGAGSETVAPAPAALSGEGGR